MNPQELSLPLTTDRLILRAYRESDAEALLPIYSREDVARFLLCDPWTAEESRTEISKRIP
ncbi:MAG: GNAT family N-acetyltransferase, partial [Brevibacterium aurantiacum]|nr:GNAT family N-acetyltransferase [Brevibacterium aurantiacum]